MFAAKATWRAAPRTSVDLSVFGDPGTRHAVGFPQGINLSAPRALLNPEPFLTLEESGGATGALRLQQQLGSSGRLELRASYSSMRSNQRPETGGSVLAPLFVDITNAWSGGPGIRTDATAHRAAASLTATGLFGSHTAKAGVDYEDNHLRILQRFDFGFQLDTASFLTNVLLIPGSVRNRTPAVFVQDSWQATRRLVVNAGIRWSNQYLIEAGSGVVQRLPNEWQPRLGLVYQPGAPGSQKVFASYGRFYQQQPLWLSANMYPPIDQLVSTFDEDPRLPEVQPTTTQNLSGDASDFPEVHGARSDHFDEVTIGYDRVIGASARLQMRGIHRRLRTAFGYGWDYSREFPFVIGNHGVGGLDFLPKASRRYSAVELTLSRAGDHRLQGQVSYVLSRTYGNYTGLFSSDEGLASPGQNLALLVAEQRVNSTGLLPNDRPHVLKLTGSYRLGHGLTVGTFNAIQSGTPLSDLGASRQGTAVPTFLVNRGSEGRTPAIWDANVRFLYAVPLRTAGADGRLVLDVLHIGSPRRPTVIEQSRFLGVDENGLQTSPNPNFGQASTYQPPMAARLGFEVDF
jgi:hypothetical protein